MQLIVKSLKGSFAVDVEDNATVHDLKVAVENTQFIPASKFVNFLLLEGRSLIEYSIDYRFLGFTQGCDCDDRWIFV